MAEVIDGTKDFLYKTGNVVWAFSLDIVSQVFGLKKPKQPSAGIRPLEDRTITVVSSDRPHRYIYGRARVGADIVAVLTSGTRDEYKHIVSVHAAHECDAIEEVYINGKALGTLDINGYVTTGDYSKLVSHTATTGMFYGGTGVTLAHTPIVSTVRCFTELGEPVAFTLIGNVISPIPGPVIAQYYCNYSYNVVDSYVRVKKYLGAVGQAADATTITEVPTKWTSTHILTGMCYTIIRLDLNFSDFQNGMPEIEVRVKGKKLHDVRSGIYPNDVPVWSQNPALMIADYLTSELCQVPWTDLPLADFITAANVCDESTAYGLKYLADGAVSSDDNQKEILDDMALCMAGTIVGTTWGVTAGKYVAPVMSLNQSDVVGDFSYTAGVPEAELYNGIKGKYISADNLYVATDFAPYQNSTYVIADGQELWSDQDFNFTSTKQRVHNLCRIFTEDQRNGFTINADFSYKAWALQVGQRVTFTSSFIGQTNKIYRIVGKSFSAGSSVRLTIKEDAASIWDLADAIAADSTPNTDFPSPFIVNIPGDIQVSEELYETTGSSGVKVRAIVTWTAPADVYILDYEVLYKHYEDANYDIKVLSVNERIEIIDIESGIFDLKIRARNRLYIYSDYTPVKTFTIYGLTTVPSNVTNFTIKPFNGSALCSWDKTIDLDVKIGGDVEIRYCPLVTGQSWEQSVVLPDGDHNGDATSAIVSLATGTYYAKFIDSTGRYSTTEASFIVTEALITGFTTVTTTTQHPTFTGAKTNVFVDNNSLKLGGTTLWDDMPLMDSWGQMDYMGGVQPIGTYLFDATVDLTTSASRRFHVAMQALSVSVSDTIDARVDLIDTWSSIDGDVINGTNATVYASVSDDNITYSGWAPFMVADFKCRYAKFKAILESNDSNQNIEVSNLAVAIKIPA